MSDTIKEIILLIIILILYYGTLTILVGMCILDWMPNALFNIMLFLPIIFTVWMAYLIIKDFKERRNEK